MDIIFENPKAVGVAIAGIILWLLKTYVITVPPDVEAWLNVILPAVILALFGRFTRISKDEAAALKTPEVKTLVENINKFKN